MSKQTGHMWGCWVRWEDDDESQWMWEIITAQSKEGKYHFPVVFARTRREIMYLVRRMRGYSWVKSAKAVKVPMPGGP